MPLLLKTKARKAPAPARTLSYDARVGVLALLVGREESWYTVEATPTVEGAVVVLTKMIGTYLAGEEDRYTVRAVNGEASCDCAAGRRGKACKHGDSVVLLIGRGHFRGAK